MVAIATACDPGAGVTWVNETDTRVAVYLSDEPGGDGSLVEPQSSKTEAVIKAVWHDVIVVRDEQGNLLFRREMTWDELEAQDFRFVIDESSLVPTPAESPPER